jgi:hypothetical protein
MARCTHHERAKLWKTNTVEKTVACKIAFGGKTYGIKLSETALFYQFDN